MRPLETIFLLLLIFVVFQFLSQERKFQSNTLIKILFALFILHFFLEQTISLLQDQFLFKQAIALLQDQLPF